MRTVLISLAAAASALAVATPASAQWTIQPYPAPSYGNGYGSGFSDPRGLQVRIDRVQWQIRDFDRRNILSNREARRLRDKSVSIEHKLLHASRNGLSPWEARDIGSRIARLEEQVHREARDRNGRWGRQAGYYGDRDFDRTHDRWHDRNDKGGRDDHDDRDDDHDDHD